MLMESYSVCTGCYKVSGLTLVRSTPFAQPEHTDLLLFRDLR
jgi:hypothetical protein